jgi:DNA-binding CsgD family transcriptional regulator
VANPKEKLCVLTPDSFYGVMLREAVLPTFEIRVLQNYEQLSSLAVNFFPNAFLLFAEHLGSILLAETLLQIRANFPEVSVFQIEGLREPRLQMLWSAKTNTALPSAPVSVTCLEDVDKAIRSLDGRQGVGLKATSLTNSQLEVLRWLAEGRTNQEIADARNTSVRAVETLLNRSLTRIADEVPSNSRAKMALAQRYLGYKF